MLQRMNTETKDNNKNKTKIDVHQMGSYIILQEENKKLK